MPILTNIILNNEKNLAIFLAYSIKRISNYLGINTEILLSSNIPKNNSLKGENKILDICMNLKATDYYNAIGGMELYSFDTFQKNGINLSFLKTNEIRYKQFNNEFVPNLSIIDVMMFNSKEEIKIMLEDYTMVKNYKILL